MSRLLIKCLSIWLVCKLELLGREMNQEHKRVNYGLVHNFHRSSLAENYKYIRKEKGHPAQVPQAIGHTRIYSPHLLVLNASSFIRGKVCKLKILGREMPNLS